MFHTFSENRKVKKKCKRPTIPSLEITTVDILACILLDLNFLKNTGENVRKITLITPITEFLFLTELCMHMFIEAYRQKYKSLTTSIPRGTYIQVSWSSK